MHSTSSLATGARTSRPRPSRRNGEVAGCERELPAVGHEAPDLADPDRFGVLAGTHGRQDRPFGDAESGLPLDAERTAVRHVDRLEFLLGPILSGDALAPRDRRDALRGQAPERRRAPCLAVEDQGRRRRGALRLRPSRQLSRGPLASPFSGMRPHSHRRVSPGSSSRTSLPPRRTSMRPRPRSIRRANSARPRRSTPTSSFRAPRCARVRGPTPGSVSCRCRRAAWRRDNSRREPPSTEGARRRRSRNGIACPP